MYGLFIYCKYLCIYIYHYVIYTFTINELKQLITKLKKQFSW